MIDITYDRKEGLYKWVHEESGEVLTAPAKMKHELFKSALGLLEPALFDAVHNWLDEEPYLERVLWRGAELAAGSGVEPFPGEGRLLAMVDSSDEYGRYSVTIDDGYIVCECAHYREGAPLDANGQKVCKHIAAFHLHQRTREDRF